MKTLFLLGTLLLLTVFTSCKTKNANPYSAQADSMKVSRTDSLQVAQLDISTPEKFIQSFIDNLKQLSEGESEVTGDLAFRKGEFMIFNFTETHGLYSYQFAVVLNPGQKIEQDAEHIEEVLTLLQMQSGLNYSFYRGNFTETKDLLNDSSPDFIKEMSSNFRTDFSYTGTIVLFDGKNKLETTEIIAQSSYDASGPAFIENDTTTYDYHGFSGVQEKFEITGENPVIIVIHGKRDYYGKGTSFYDKTWRLINNGGAWVAEMISQHPAENLESGEYQKRIAERLSQIPILKQRFQSLYRTENQKQSGKWISLNVDYFNEGSTRYFSINQEGNWFTLDFGDEMSCCDRYLVHDIQIGERNITFVATLQSEGNVSLWNTDVKAAEKKQFNFNPARNLLDDGRVGWVNTDSLKNYIKMFDQPLEGDMEEGYPYLENENLSTVKKGTTLYKNPGENIIGTLPAGVKCVLIKKASQATIAGKTGFWYEVDYILSKDSKRISGVRGWIFGPETSKAES